jgi:hypothetical protein
MDTREQRTKNARSKTEDMRWNTSPNKKMALRAAPHCRRTRGRGL